MIDTSTPTITTEAVSEADWPKTATRLTNPSPFKLAIQAAITSGNAQRTSGFPTIEEARKFRASLNTAANDFDRGMESRTVSNEDGTFGVYWRVLDTKRPKTATVAEAASPAASPAKGK